MCATCHCIAKLQLHRTRCSLLEITSWEESVDAFWSVGGRKGGRAGVAWMMWKRACACHGSTQKALYCNTFMSSDYCPIPHRWLKQGLALESDGPDSTDHKCLTEIWELTILRGDYENENQYAIILTRIWNTYQDPFYSFDHGSEVYLQAI